MAKKTESKNVAKAPEAEAAKTNPTQLIDTEKLTESLVSFYEGVAGVMDSFCKAADGMNELYRKLNFLCSDLKYASCKDIPSAMDPDYCIPDEVEEMKREEADEVATTEVTAKAETQAPAESAKAAKPERPVEALKAVEASNATEQPKPAPTISQDDLTKIITTKLRKDKSNSDKILALLKSYGCAKVSELPAEKYEAFVTDISQL